MNARQVRALNGLMDRAKPPRPRELDGYETEAAELHAAIEVAQGADDGNTYAARLWTVEVGYFFPDGDFFLMADGRIYVWESEANEGREVKSVRWEKRERYGRELRVEMGEVISKDTST